MLVKKKDWEDLSNRVNLLTTQFYEQEISNCKKVSVLELRITELQRMTDKVRNTLFGVLSAVKNCFGEYHIYTETEINDMSGDDYKNKVLKPLFINSPRQELGSKINNPRF